MVEVVAGVGGAVDVESDTVVVSTVVSVSSSVVSDSVKVSVVGSFSLVEGAPVSIVPIVPTVVSSVGELRETVASAIMVVEDTESSVIVIFPVDKGALSVGVMVINVDSD